MRRRTGAVVLVGFVAGWGLSALLEETGVLGWTVAAETFYQKDGIELSGSVRVVARGVGTCEVREESHSEGVYEQIKDNHGQPLDVWRLDYSAYNGSGNPLSSLSAHFRIESEWPPCTSWTGPEGTYAKPVQWSGSFQVLQKPYGMGPGEEVSDTVFVLVFHEHRPRFESWDVNYRFGKVMSAPATPPGAGAPAAAVGRGRPTAGDADQGARRVPRPARERLPYEPEMVVIPGGSFRMGCVSGIGCNRNYEFPVHEVRVGTFELGKYEVTFEEYDRFTSATGREQADEQTWLGWGRGRRAVTMVSWEDAVAYTRWLSRQTGQQYRLPSEAEWEYAARAGTETVYSWGNEFDCNRAHESDCGRRAAHRQLVGLFAPNDWGLYDMHGNVSEWVQDCWNDSYQGAPADGSAWESRDCTYRVTRGGSGANYNYMRSSFRNRWTPNELPQFSIGFRVARTVTP